MNAYLKAHQKDFMPEDTKFSRALPQTKRLGAYQERQRA